MRNDVEELKKLVHSVLKNENYDGDEILKQHEDLFEIKPSNQTSSKSLDNTNLPYILHSKEDNEEYDAEEVQDADHEIEEESLSLEKKEKEMIQRALEKNNNKRKYAAQDLGISERTLYRKIKQYDLQN